MTSDVRLGAVATTRVSNVDKHSVEGQVPVRLCNYTDVYHHETITPDMQFMGATATPEQVAAFRLRAGDVVITKDSETADDIGVPAYISAGATDLVCGYHLAIVRPDRRLIFPRYLFWSLMCQSVATQWEVLANGVTRVGLKSSDLKTVQLWVPDSLPEQQVIAAYLDRETAKIDLLIEKQTRLIDRLRERRAAVTERAVVDSVHPRVPLGATAALIQTGPFGSQLNAEEYVVGGTPVINPQHVVAGRIMPQQNVSVSPETAARLRRHRLQRGDVVAARRGELGRCAVTTDSEVGYICGTGSLLIRPSKDHWSPEFLQLSFSARQTADALQQSSVGSTMPNLNSSMVSRLRLPCPSVDRQLRITATVREQAAKIDHLIDKTERFIELTKERRSALITAAVTGQIDVRGKVA